jgi:predicted dienelactone hydrolase
MMHRPPVRVVVTAGVAIVAVVAAVAVVALRADDSHDPRADAARTSSSAAPTSTTEPEPRPVPVAHADAPTPVTKRVAHTGEYAVDETELTIVDPDQDNRVVAVAVWYPHAAGAFPLVVFAHGFGTGPDRYADFLTDLASSGHIVAAPRPYALQAMQGMHTEDPAPDPDAVADPTGEEPPPQPDGDGFDFAGQRRDLVAIIDVLGGADVPEELRGRVAGSKVTAIGHSDGGITAAALAFNSNAGDPRVGAAVIISGDYGQFGGTWFADGSPALLAIHGDADGVNPVGASVGLFLADRGGPRYLVVVHGAGHLDLLTDDPPVTMVVDLVTDFIAAYVGNDPGALDRVNADADGDVLELVAAG